MIPSWVTKDSEKKKLLKGSHLFLFIYFMYQHLLYATTPVTTRRVTNTTPFMSKELTIVYTIISTRTFSNLANRSRRCWSITLYS